MFFCTKKIKIDTKVYCVYCVCAFFVYVVLQKLWNNDFTNCQNNIYLAFITYQLDVIDKIMFFHKCSYKSKIYIFWSN